MAAVGSLLELSCFRLQTHPLSIWRGACHAHRTAVTARRAYCIAQRWVRLPDTTRVSDGMQVQESGKLADSVEKRLIRACCTVVAPDRRYNSPRGFGMEANEIHEFNEQQEEASHKRDLFPISFTISVLAVFVALTTVMGHRAHTAAVLEQARATDHWNLYQAKKIRDFDTGLTVDLLTSLAVKDSSATAKLLDGYKAHRAKWAGELDEEQKVAKEFEDRVEVQERRAARFDLGEALLQIGVVIVAITLLTRQRAYWFFGMAFGLAGLICAALGFLAH